jgi:hypothetical protein
MQTHAEDLDYAERDSELAEKKYSDSRMCSHFLGEQRAAKRSGAPAHQAQDQAAGPREQGFLSGQAFHIYCN